MGMGRTRVLLLGMNISNYQVPGFGLIQKRMEPYSWKKSYLLITFHFERTFISLIMEVHCSTYQPTRWILHLEMTMLMISDSSAQCWWHVKQVSKLSGCPGKQTMNQMCDTITFWKALLNTWIIRIDPSMSWNDYEWLHNYPITIITI
jgi:hypothetical protein